MEALMNNSAFGISPDSIIVKEIVTIISSAINGGNSAKGCLKDRLGKLWNIALLLGIPLIMKNMDKLGKVFSRICFILFYRRMELDITAGLDFTLSTLLDPFLPSSATDEKYINGVPIFAQKGTKVIFIDYCPLFHSSFLSKKREEAKAKYDESLKSKVTLINCIDTKKEPMELYDSKNFKKAGSIIQEFFRVLQCKKSFNSQAILIHGERGLGKTCFLESVAYQKLAETVIYMNLTKTVYLSLDFKVCIDKIYSIAVKGTCVIHIDEIDKHLDYRIKMKYNEMKYGKEEIPSSTSADSQSKKEMKKIPSLEEFIETEKISFLYDLLNLIETDRFPNGVVFILTCNNFETLFSGVDITHFHSLKRRFLNVTFEKCDLEDFKGYCHFYNESFKEKIPEKYIDPQEMEELFAGIDENIRVPFWRIHQGLCGSSFCIRTLVEIFKDYKEEENISFSPSILLKDPSFYSREEKEEDKEEEKEEEKEEDKKEDKKEEKEEKEKEEYDDEEQTHKEEEKYVGGPCPVCNDNEIDTSSEEVCWECEQSRSGIVKPYSFLGWEANGMLEKLPSRTEPCTKSVLSEISDLQLSENIAMRLTDEMVELADRISRFCEDGMFGTTLYIYINGDITESISKEDRSYIRMYFAIKLFQYLTSEKCISLFYGDGLRHKKLRDTIVAKLIEMNGIEELSANPAFQMLFQEIQGRVKNVDKD
jgi:hypothetical protein